MKERRAALLQFLSSGEHLQLSPDDLMNQNPQRPLPMRSRRYKNPNQLLYIIIFGGEIKRGRRVIRVGAAESCAVGTRAKPRGSAAGLARLGARRRLHSQARDTREVLSLSWRGRKSRQRKSGLCGRCSHCYFGGLLLLRGERSPHNLSTTLATEYQ